MVRAAVTGAFDYTGSDPTNKQWRLRHRLIILGLMDREDKELLQSIHQHWLGYLSHGNLTKESFENVKTRATEILQDIKKATYPWAAKEEKQQTENGTIKPQDADLIERFKARQEQFKREMTGK